MLYLCRASDEYSLMALLCLAIGASLTLHSAVADAYLPLLATSNVSLARALLFAPPKKKKKKKRKKKKKKKKKKDNDKNKSNSKIRGTEFISPGAGSQEEKELSNKKGSGKRASSADSVPSNQSSGDLEEESKISRKPIPLQHAFTRVQDRLSGRSMCRSMQSAFVASVFVAGWIWWFADGADPTDDVVNLSANAANSFLRLLGVNGEVAISESKKMKGDELLAAAANVLVPVRGESSMYYLPPRFGVDYIVSLRWGIMFCVLFWFLSLVPSLCCLRWRFGESCSTSCARGWFHHATARRRCAWFWAVVHVMVPILPLLLWSWSRTVFFFQYVWLLPQLKWIVLWWVLVTESLRSFGRSCMFRFLSFFLFHFCICFFLG